MRRSRATWCSGATPAEPAPDLLVCVVDATNLRLNLRLVLDLKRLGRPMIVALNMSDVAEQRGYRLDRAALERALGVPVVPTVAVRAGGERALVEAIDAYDFDAAARRAHARRAPEAPPAGAPPRTSRRRSAKCAACCDEAGYRVPARAAALARLDAVVLHPVAGPLLLARGAVPHVPGGVQLGEGRRRTSSTPACSGSPAGSRSVLPAGPAARPAARRRDRRHRQRAGVPAADPDPVPLHPRARGLRLPAARGLHARPAHGAGRPLRTRLHSAAVELRLRHPRHHGRAHHSVARATGSRPS